MSDKPGIVVQRKFEERYIPEPMSGCWIWVAGRNPCGYGTIQESRKTHLAHRVAWRLFRGEIPNGLCVLHKCDTPACVNPDHLWLGTQLENIADRERKQRRRPPRGILNGRAKITEGDVLAIRADTRRIAEIAEVFGLGKTQVRAIKNMQRWSHV